ncbi:uncharacterized protein [Panulirus ornatus]|uniref:uncharacterized protein n=1 Tax=Panulirus ornatus TaxID=150431 RepID=UPI003A888AB3
MCNVFENAESFSKSEIAFGMIQQFSEKSEKESESGGRNIANKDLRGVRLIKGNTLRVMRRCGRIKRLGAGAYGSCSWINVFGADIVVKTFLKGTETNTIHQELNGLQANQGPGRQKMYGFCPETGEVVSKYSGISLEKALKEDLLTPEKAAYVLLKVIKITQAVFKRNYCHNDIRPANICLKHIEREKPDVTLIDFGLATSLGEEVYVDLGVERDGEFLWLAPEMKRGGKCSEGSEVYSIAQLATELLKVWATTDHFRNWLTRCLSNVAGERPSLSDGVTQVQALLKSMKDRKRKGLMERPRPRLRC